MSNELIFVLVFFWVVSAAYVMYTHNKEYTLGLDMIIGAILLGPILALFVKDGGEHEIKKLHYIEENDRHRRWFRTIGEINRQRMTSFGRSIPPPPPISRIAQVQSERDNAIRMARERIDKNGLKGFKFFQK